MTHKEFYIWLDGFMTNRDWTTIGKVDIEGIQEKMKEVKDELPSYRIGNDRPNPFIPIPVSPLTKIGDIPPPPWEVTCNSKTQLND